MRGCVSLETAFYFVRAATGLGSANIEFANYSSEPPVFYFAELGELPAGMEGYREDRSDSLRSLARTCLGSDDPSSEDVSWGVLEGDLVTLRRESLGRDLYRTRYLLLPLARKSPIQELLERDIYGIVDQLGYLGFTIPYEASDIYTDIEPLAVCRT